MSVVKLKDSDTSIYLVLCISGMLLSPLISKPQIISAPKLSAIVFGVHEDSML